MVFIWRRWIDSVNLERGFGLSRSITERGRSRLWCKPSSVPVSLRVHGSGTLLKLLDLDVLDPLWKCIWLSTEILIRAECCVCKKICWFWKWLNQVEATCSEGRNVLGMTSFTGGLTAGRTAVPVFFFFFSLLLWVSTCTLTCRFHWEFKVELHTSGGAGGQIFQLL